MSKPGLELAVFMFNDGTQGKKCTRLSEVKAYLEALPEGEIGRGIYYVKGEGLEIFFMATLEDGKVDIQEGNEGFRGFYLEQRFLKLYLVEK